MEYILSLNLPRSLLNMEGNSIEEIYCMNFILSESKKMKELGAIKKAYQQCLVRYSIFGF